MGILSSLFGGKKDIASILADTQRKIFKIYGISKPTDAQKMKASVYICIAGIAIFNELGELKPYHLIDNLVEETKKLTGSLSMRIGELANNKKELKEILADFPKQALVDESVYTDGFTAFEALYNTKVKKLLRDILSHSNGPYGAPAYSAIIVVDGILGEGKSRDHSFEILMLFTDFAKELYECI